MPRLFFAGDHPQEIIHRLTTIPIIVMQDELETAMRNTGITSLEQACPELVHTGDVDHLVPASRQHPYARAVAKNRRQNRASKL